jgi:hypothetical protein
MMLQPPTVLPVGDLTGNDVVNVEGERLGTIASYAIDLEQLPGYAPELTPAEGIWNYLQRVELKNLCCQSIPHLYYEVRKAANRLRHKTKVILGCITQAGFY